MAVDVRMEGAARELAAAMEDLQARTGRLYPTWSEVLAVLRELGYRKTDAPPQVEEPPPEEGRCYLIQVDSDEPEWASRIASAVASLGGRETDVSPGILAFATESARDAALAAVRHAFGRSAALPAAGPCRTWWPADIRQEGAFDAAASERSDTPQPPGPRTPGMRVDAGSTTSANRPLGVLGTRRG
jgi:hypothetical protein